jgi:hypothetical protein
MFNEEKIKAAEAEKRAETKKERETGRSILSTESGQSMIADLLKEGGPMARRLSREIKRAQATGRVSNWLAGQAAKQDTKRQISSTDVEALLKRGVIPPQLVTPPPPPKKEDSHAKAQSTYDLLICDGGETKILTVLVMGSPRPLGN